MASTPICSVGLGARRTVAPIDASARPQGRGEVSTAIASGIAIPYTIAAILDVAAGVTATLAS